MGRREAIDCDSCHAKDLPQEQIVTFIAESTKQWDDNELSPVRQPVTVCADCMSKVMVQIFSGLLRPTQDQVLRLCGHDPGLRIK